MTEAGPLSRGRAISRNAAALLAGRIVTQLLTALFTIVLARRLGAAGFGAYAFVVAVVFLANVVTTFGTDMVLIRDVAGGSGRPRWEAALAVQLGLSIVAIALAWLFAPLAAGLSSGAADALRIYSLSLIPAAVFSVCAALLRGLGRMGTYASLGVATASAQLAILWLLPPGSALVAVMAALLAVQIAAAVLAWALCARTFAPLRRSPRTSADDVLEMVRATGTLGTLGLLGMAYQRVPILVLAAVAGPTATGWFASASKIVEASKVGHVALFGAAYPAMVEAHARGGSETDGLAWSRRAAFGGGALISAVLVVAAPNVVRVLFGSSFAPAAPALAILAASLLPSVLSIYQSLDLVARHREAATLRAQLASLLALLGLVAVLVPTFGWIGGCWAVFGAEIVQASLLFAFGREPSDRAVQRSRVVAGSDAQ